MTKHYELIYSNSGQISSAEKFCRFALHLCLQMCVNMADPTQPSGVGGSYVDTIEWSVFIFSTGTEPKKFPLLIISCLRRYDTNVRSQMQGCKNWILPKEIKANRFFWDSHWLEIWKNLLCPSTEAIA